LISDSRQINLINTGGNRRPEEAFFNHPSRNSCSRLFYCSNTMYHCFLCNRS